MLKVLECGGLSGQANTSEWSRLMYLVRDILNDGL